MDGCRQGWRKRLAFPRQDVRIVNWADVVILLFGKRFRGIAIGNAEITVRRVARNMRRRVHGNTCMPDKHGNQ